MVSKYYWGNTRQHKCRGTSPILAHLQVHANFLWLKRMNEPHREQQEPAVVSQVQPPHTSMGVTVAPGHDVDVLEPLGKVWLTPAVIHNLSLSLFVLSLFLFLFLFAVCHQQINTSCCLCFCVSSLYPRINMWLQTLFHTTIIVSATVCEGE